MKFQFRLESVLKMRANEEQLALRSMMEAQNELDQQQRKLNELYQELDRAREVRHEETAKSQVVNAAVYIEHFIQGQEVKIDRQRHLIREKKTALEERQDQYRDALLRLRALEKLKENQFEEFKKKLSKRETKVVDDMISVRFGLKETEFLNE